MMRTIVIGDLQGCYDDTIRLLDKCKTTKEDWVIFAGDLVDRGPDSAKCLDLAMRRETLQGKPAAILGNHEEKHLLYHTKKQRGEMVCVNIPSHIQTIEQLKPEHYEYMKRLPLFIRLPEHNAAVVHAGVFPGKTLEEQDPHHLLHIQSIDPPDPKSKWPSKAPEHWKFWTQFYKGPERIIFGHSVLDVPLLTDKVCGIDGGACFGMELRAVILPDWEIVSVKAEKNYGKGFRGRPSEEEMIRGASIKKYWIHDKSSTFS